MRLLKDTQAFTYLINAPDELPSNARKALEDPANELLVSVITPLEMQIKVNLGKLKFAASPVELLKNELNRGTFVLLPLTFDHIDALGRLPHHHKDPFDRLLVGQALAENLTIVTGDEKVAKYSVPTLWR